MLSLLRTAVMESANICHARGHGNAHFKTKGGNPCTKYCSGLEEGSTSSTRSFSRFRNTHAIMATRRERESGGLLRGRCTLPVCPHGSSSSSVGGTGLQPR